jgi:hypothetical protein
MDKNKRQNQSRKLTSRFIRPIHYPQKCIAIPRRQLGLAYPADLPQFFKIA